jgi:uncharacterized membrane protein YozB (DUF420 family)
VSGLFGTKALLQTDLDLLLQVVAFVFLLVGYLYFRSRKYRMHVGFMGTALLLNSLSFLIVMGPVFMKDFRFFSTTPFHAGLIAAWLHLVPGTATLILGLGLFAVWALRSSPVIACAKRKRLMNLTILLWSLSFSFGVAMYLLFYL